MSDVSGLRSEWHEKQCVFRLRLFQVGHAVQWTRRSPFEAAGHTSGRAADDRDTLCARKSVSLGGLRVNVFVCSISKGSANFTGATV